MLGRYWTILKTAVSGFIEDDALSHGAAIAYYTVFSLAPVLVIVIAVAGLFFGHDAAEGAIVGQLRGLMGDQAAQAIQDMVKSAANHDAGVVATVLGIGTLLLTASGIFGEMQSSLNIIWKAQPRESAVSRLVRARLISLGLVMALGFLLLTSLVVSAGLEAMGTWMTGFFPGWRFVAQVLNLAISFILLTMLFAAIYKALPDTHIAWRDVIVGALATSFLFSVGKYLIGLYIGSSAIASSYGAAGALAVMLVWIYYSAQIFLLGAEFTWAHATLEGSHAGKSAAASAAPAKPAAAPLPLGSSDPEIRALAGRLDAERLTRL